MLHVVHFVLVGSYLMCQSISYFITGKYLDQRGPSPKSLLYIHSAKEVNLFVNTDIKLPETYTVS